MPAGSKGSSQFFYAYFPAKTMIDLFYVFLVLVALPVLAHLIP